MGSSSEACLAFLHSHCTDTNQYSIRIQLMSLVLHIPNTLTIFSAEPCKFSSADHVPSPAAAHKLKQFDKSALAKEQITM